MINFLDNSYTTVGITYDVNKDWLVIKHFEKYRDILSDVDNYMNGILASFDSIGTDTCDYNSSSWDEIKTTFTPKPLSTLVMDLSTEILRCDTCANGTANPRVVYDPTFGKIDGIFVKLVDALDKGVGNFLQNYTMAKQVSKYECDFMRVFEQYLVVQDAIKDGSIMYYFDDIITKFNKDLQNFKYYVEYNDSGDSNADCNSKKNFCYAYFNSYTVPDIGQQDRPTSSVQPFSTSMATYKDKLKEGLKDLNTLVDAMQGFLDEIYIGVKVIGALNIVFYADPADQTMLQKQSQSVFSSMTPPVGQDADTDIAKLSLQSRTIWAMCTAVPMAISAQQYIDNRRTNQATVFARTVIATFSSIGIQDDIDLLKVVLDGQHS